MMKKRWLLLCLLLLLSGCTQQSVEKMPEEPPVTVGESTPGAPMPENEAELPVPFRRTLRSSTASIPRRCTPWEATAAGTTRR